MPVAVAISRMYRGEHHPTDILGSLLFSALWLTAAYLLIRPNRRPRPGGPRYPRRPAAADGRDGRPRVCGARDGASALSQHPRARPGPAAVAVAPGSMAI
jgi:hypothetical protein